MTSTFFEFFLNNQFDGSVIRSSTFPHEYGKVHISKRKIKYLKSTFPRQKVKIIQKPKKLFLVCLNVKTHLGVDHLHDNSYSVL